MSDLEEMFGEVQPKKVPEPVEVEQEKPEPEATEGEEPEGEGEKQEEPEQTAAKEPPAEPPSAEKSDEASAYKAAMLEERRKRQEIERRLQELEQGKEPEAKKKVFWEDPEAVIAERVSEVERRFTHRLLVSSEAVAREKHSDYGEKIVAFQEAMQRDPTLYERMRDDVNPAEFAYRVGKTYLVTKDAPDIDTLTAKIREQVLAEEREKIRKEIEEESRAKKFERVPESLSEQTGTTTRHEKVKTGPLPIESLFDN